jgi:hypothetical protein
MKKKYMIFTAIVILLLIIPFFIALITHNHKKTQMHTSVLFPSSVPLPVNGKYITEDSTTAPQVSSAAVQGTIARESRNYHNHVWEKFILTNKRTGSSHVLFEQQDDSVQFEKMTVKNWSPTNRFFYIFFDLPDGRRNLLIFETDGRFTDTNYYLKPVTLAQDETVSKAFWYDDETLYFDLTSQKNKNSSHYEVDLNDSTGNVKQLSAAK